jgi:hypothetical protein
MGPLHNSRHEQFAQLVATGKTPAEAYGAAGYAEKTAYTCGPRLLKIPTVNARVAELQRTVAQAVVLRIVIDRHKVRAGLWEIAQKGNSESARVRAYELVGKDLGMFVEPKFDWDGDPATLTDGQLEKLKCALEKMAVGEEEARVLQQRRELKLEGGGPVIDLEPGPAPEWCHH